MSEIKKKDAIEELGYDVLTSNPYDLFRAVDVNADVEACRVKYIGEEPEEKECISTLNDFTDWLTDYKNMNRPDRLSISDVAVVKADTDCIHGVVLLVNGLNGRTQVSRQSLKHVWDVICHLEDYYGARAWISSVWMHSDVYYYTVSFAIWPPKLAVGETFEWGNLKPLYHWE